MSENVKEQLDCPISKEEIKSTTFELGPPKAPRHDGFQVGFKKYWDIVGKDVTQFSL